MTYSEFECTFWVSTWHGIQTHLYSELVWKFPINIDTEFNILHFTQSVGLTMALNSMDHAGFTLKVIQLPLTPSVHSSDMNQKV